MKKYILVLLGFLVFCSSACTTMRVVDIPNEQLSASIESDRVIKVGQKVSIITTAGITHTFKVTRITPEKIIGDEIEIPINEITALETEHFSAGKSVGLVLGSIVVLTILAFKDIEDDIQDALSSN